MIGGKRYSGVSLEASRASCWGKCWAAIPILRPVTDVDFFPLSDCPCGIEVYGVGGLVIQDLCIDFFIVKRVVGIPTIAGVGVPRIYAKPVR